MSLLLDALQRASREKEKLAEERAAAEKSPQPSATALSAPVLPLSYESAPSESPRLNESEPVKPPIAMVADSSGQPEPVQALPTKSPADGRAESAVKSAELALDPLHQTTTAVFPTAGPAPFEAVVPDVPAKPVVAETTVEHTPDQARGPTPAHVEPGLSFHTESEPTPVTSSSAQPQPRSVASSQVAREILDATAKTSKSGPNRRLIVLGGVALLFAAANAVFFLGYLDSILGLSSPQLGPVASVTPVEAPPATATEPEATVDGKKSVESPATVEVKTETQVAAAASIPPPPASSMESSKSSSGKVTSPSQSPEERVSKASSIARKSAPQEVSASKIQPVFIAKPAAASALDTAYAALVDGRFEDAVGGYKRVLAKNPGERDALLGMAYIAQRQGSREEARAYYQQVLRLQPGHPGASAGLLTLAAEGDLQLTASRAREMAERNPESAVALSTLAGLLAKEGRIAEAQQAYFKALALEPDNALHAYNLAVALDRLHKYGPAQTYYQRSLTLAEKSGAGEKLGFPGREAARRLEQLRAQQPERNSLSAGNASNNGQR